MTPKRVARSLGSGASCEIFTSTLDHCHGGFPSGLFVRSTVAVMFRRHLSSRRYSAEYLVRVRVCVCVCVCPGALRCAN